MTTAAILDAISRCPQLRSCTLAVSDAPPIDTHPEDLFVDLAFLRTLEIYCIGNITHTISNLLQRLSVPALGKFLFRGRRGVASDRSLAPFIGLATRLEDFDLDSEIFSGAYCVQTLRSLPATVRRLVIGPAADSPFLPPPSNPLDDDILALLTPSVDSLAVCCPVLRTLIVRYGGLISDAALLHFITARKNAATLHRVAVEFHRTRTLELDRLLAPLIQTGLEVSISHFPLRTFSTGFSPWNGIDDGTESFEPAVVCRPYRSFKLRVANWWNFGSGVRYAIPLTSCPSVTVSQRTV